MQSEMALGFGGVLAPRLLPLGVFGQNIRGDVDLLGDERDHRVRQHLVMVPLAAKVP
jgi:hypothetical protein